MRAEYFNNICSYFHCAEEEIRNFRPLPGGLVNESYLFELHGDEYVYRHPGKGSEQLIIRENEKRSLLTARQYGFDPTFLYMDGLSGWKISRYVKDFREPDYKNAEDSAKVAGTLRRLHKVPYRAEYGIRPWEDALKLEGMLKVLQSRGLKVLQPEEPKALQSEGLKVQQTEVPQALQPEEPKALRQEILKPQQEKKSETHRIPDEKNLRQGQDIPYETLKTNVGKLCQKVIGDGIEPCFCHGDSYKPNWMLLPDGEVILIDWEYAGCADPGIDVGYYIADAGYDFEEAKLFIREYLGADYSEKKEYHFLAYTAIIAYYWYVWALYREASGTISPEVIREPLSIWRDAAERFAEYLL